MRCRDQIICSCFESRLEAKQARIGKAGDGWNKEIIKIEYSQWVSVGRRYIKGEKEGMKSVTSFVYL